VKFCKQIWWSLNNKIIILKIFREWPLTTWLWADRALVSASYDRCIPTLDDWCMDSDGCIPQTRLVPEITKKERKMWAVLTEITLQISKCLIMAYSCSSGTSKYYVVTHYLGTWVLTDLQAKKFDNNHVSILCPFHFFPTKDWHLINYVILIVLYWSIWDFWAVSSYSHEDKPCHPIQHYRSKQGNS